MAGSDVSDMMGYDRVWKPTAQSAAVGTAVGASAAALLGYLLRKNKKKVWMDAALGGIGGGLVGGGLGGMSAAYQHGRADEQEYGEDPFIGSRTGVEPARPRRL